MIYRLKPLADKTSVSEFLESVGASNYPMVGRGNAVLRQRDYFSSVAEAEEGTIAYFYAADVTRWEDFTARLAACPAALLIVNSELSLFLRPRINQQILYCPQPKACFANLVRASIEEVGTSYIACKDPTCQTGPNVQIEQGATIGTHVSLGANCYIHGNVTIGDNVQIKAHSIIGGQGFEFYKDEHGEQLHFPHTGSVRISDNVYVGSGVVIDAGVFKPTIIRKGTKIDNLASIAHNVEIGENCLVMANTSIAGSVKIGAGSRICLAASIRDGVTIGQNTVVGMNACVTKDIPDNVTAYGVPATIVTEKSKPDPTENGSTRNDLARTVRLIRETVQRLKLDLSDYSVITEAATGNFAVTASIAALAGAKVQAIAADSAYGSFAAAARATLRIASALGVVDRVTVLRRDQADFACADIITNLGFVRPCDQAIVERLKPGAVIPVMYDARELRPGEIDLDRCRERGIHVVGTNEEHPHADILNYCGPLAVKLLMEQNLELRGLRCAVAGENFFTKPIVNSLERLGSEVTLIGDWQAFDETLLRSLDVLLFIDYWRRLGDIADNDAANLLPVASGATLLQFVGGLDLAPFASAGWNLAPSTPVAPQRMWRTLAYLGPKPVIELHAAGLKAAELELKGSPHARNTPFDGLRQPIIAFRPAEIASH